MLRRDTHVDVRVHLLALVVHARRRVPGVQHALVVVRERKACELGVLQHVGELFDGPRLCVHVREVARHPVGAAGGSAVAKERAVVAEGARRKRNRPVRRQLVRVEKHHSVAVQRPLRVQHALRLQPGVVGKNVACALARDNAPLKTRA